MIYTCPHCQRPVEADAGRIVGCPICAGQFATPIQIASRGAPSIRAYRAQTAGEGIEAFGQFMFAAARLALWLGVAWVLLSCAGIL